MLLGADSRVCTRLYASARDYTRLHAIERDLTRFYASGTLGVFFLIEISDLGLAGLAWLSGGGRIYASARDYARFNASVRISHFVIDMPVWGLSGLARYFIGFM